MDAEDPALIVFTSGTTGEPRGAVHPYRYLMGQRIQAEHWFGCRRGELAWCTTATGWSKSARNVFLAPWLTGAAAVLHEGRFDPDERLEITAALGVNVLCQAPTEYRMLARRTALRPLPQLRRMVSAGEALDPETIAAFREATGLEPADGYGQTETGQVTANLVGEPVRVGSMGKPLPGLETRIADGELQLRAASSPTFFSGYLDGERLRGRVVADRRPGPRRRGRLPLLRGPKRRHHRLLRLPDRAGRGRGRAPLPPRRRRRRRGRRAGPRARRGRPRRRRPPRRQRSRRRPRQRADRPLPRGQRPLQGPPHRRVRRRAAADQHRQDPPRRPPRRRLSTATPALASSSWQRAAGGARSDRAPWRRRWPMPSDDPVPQWASPRADLRARCVPLLRRDLDAKIPEGFAIAARGRAAIGRPPAAGRTPRRRICGSPPASSTPAWRRAGRPGLLGIEKQPAEPTSTSRSSASCRREGEGLGSADGAVRGSATRGHPRHLGPRISNIVRRPVTAPPDRRAQLPAACDVSHWPGLR